MKSLAHQHTGAHAAAGPPGLDLDFEDTPTGEIVASEAGPGLINALGALVAQPAIAIEATTPLATAAQLLVRHRVPALAVIDNGNRLRGVVTRTDVLRALDQPGADTATAEDIMSSFVIALPACATIERAAALMAYEGVGQVIVTGPRGQLIGMVSAVDVARHFAARSGYLQPER